VKKMEGRLQRREAWFSRRERERGSTTRATARHTTRGLGEPLTRPYLIQLFNM
jgi:hypothetical protein